MDEREWQINCFGMETGKTMVKESWINGKYAFVFAKGRRCMKDFLCLLTEDII